MGGMEKSEQVPSFEEALGKLEGIVQQLEEGQLGLTDALSRYEEGIQHLKACYQTLQQAERRIELLAGVDAQGNPVTQPFDDAELTVEEKAESRSRRRSKTPAKGGEKRASESSTDGGDDAAGDVMDSGGRLF